MLLIGYANLYMLSIPQAISPFHSFPLTLSEEIKQHYIDYMIKNDQLTKHLIEMILIRLQSYKTINFKQRMIQKIK